MRWKYITFMLILLIPLAFSQTLELNKNEFSVGETLVAYVYTKYPLTGEFSNVNLHIMNEYGRGISSPFYVVKLTGGKYVAYMTIPDSYTGNKYTLRVDNIYYIKDGILEHFVWNEDFTMKSKAGKLLSVDPAGVHIDFDKDNQFYLNLKNTGSEKLKLELKYGIDYFDISQNNFELNPGENKNIRVTVKKAGENTLNILYDEGRLSYTIRVFAEGKPDIQETPLPPSGALSFVGINNELSETINEGEVERGIIKLKNNWNYRLTNIKLAVSSSIYDYVNIDPNEITSLGPGEEKEVFVIINENQNLHADFEGDIVVESDEKAKLQLPVVLYYSANEQTSSETVEETETSEEGFVPIKSDTEIVEEKEATLGTILSLIAILFVLIITVIIIFKLKKAKPTRKKKH